MDVEDFFLKNSDFIVSSLQLQLQLQLNLVYGLYVNACAQCSENLYAKFGEARVARQNGRH